VVDGSKLVVSTDATFNDVSVAQLRSDSNTLLDRTQKISSDGSATYITGDLNCDSNINVQGQLFNINAETKVSDHFLVQSDGGSVSAVKIENSNNTSPPLVVDHSGVSIFSLGIDGTISNSNIQQIELNLATEISDRETAVSNEATSRQNADTTLQTNIDNLQASVNNTTNSLQGEIDAVEIRANDLEDKTQNITADEDETIFDALTQIKWGSGEQYFSIKSRELLSVVASNSADHVLDFQSHQYSISGANTGVYEVCLMSSDASSSTPFFNGKLVKYSDSGVMYPIASYKVSASYTHATDTISFVFDDEAITKDFIVSWQLIN